MIPELDQQSLEARPQKLALLWQQAPPQLQFLEGQQSLEARPQMQAMLRQQGRHAVGCAE